MVEQRNVIEAEMDLKVEKQMVRSEFNNLLQKLTLKMWNDCSKVFAKERWDEFKSMVQDQEPNEDSSLSKFEIEACKNLFVLKDFHVVIANSMVPHAHDHFKATKAKVSVT